MSRLLFFYFFRGPLRWYLAIKNAPSSWKAKYPFHEKEIRRISIVFLSKIFRTADPCQIFSLRREMKNHTKHFFQGSDFFFFPLRNVAVGQPLDLKVFYSSSRNISEYVQVLPPTPFTLLLTQNFRKMSRTPSKKGDGCHRVTSEK